jgi:hypothetical protein
LAAALAARNPPSDDLLTAAGPRARSALRAVASTSRTGSLVAAVESLANQLLAAPPYRLRTGVVGPLLVWRDGRPLDHPARRRDRVRALLCHLVAHRRARREAVANELWPDLADPAHNVRVTLNYFSNYCNPSGPVVSLRTS